MAPRRINAHNKGNDNPLTQAAAKLKAQREAKKGTKSKKVNVGTSSSGTAAPDAVDSADVHPPKFRGKAHSSQASPNLDTSQMNNGEVAGEVVNSNRTGFASHRPLAVINEEEAPELPTRKPKSISSTGNKDPNNKWKATVASSNNEAPTPPTHKLDSVRHASKPTVGVESRTQPKTTVRRQSLLETENAPRTKPHIALRAIPVETRSRRNAHIEWENPYELQDKGTAPTIHKPKKGEPTPEDEPGDPETLAKSRKLPKESGNKRKIAEVETDVEGEVKRPRELVSRRGGAAASGPNTRNQLMESTNKRKAAEMQSDEEASAKLKRARGRTLKQTLERGSSAAPHDENEPPRAPARVRNATRGTGAAKPRRSAENEGHPKSAQRNATDRESRLERELEEMKAKLQQLTAANDKHTDAANPKEAIDDVDKGIIPHPGGSAGDGYTLQINMCLTYDKPFYNAIRRTVRELAIKAGIDFDVPYTRNSVATLAKVFKVARSRHPYLKRFEKDWATAAILQGFIKGRRVYRNRLAKMRADDEQDEDDVEAAVANQGANNAGQYEDDEGESGDRDAVPEEEGMPVDEQEDDEQEDLYDWVQQTSDDDG